MSENIPIENCVMGTGQHCTLVAVVETKLEDFRTSVERRLDLLMIEIAQVKVEAKKTNGRVNGLERFRSIAIGFSICFTMFVLPMAIWYFKDVIVPTVMAFAH